MTLRDDPILTAYALDALDPAERADVERRLATDPDARTAVAEIRATADTLSSGLAAEGAPAFEPAARRRVTRAAAGGGVVVAFRPSRWRAVIPIGAAATLLVLAGSFAMNMTGGAASREPVTVARSHEPVMTKASEYSTPGGSPSSTDGMLSVGGERRPSEEWKREGEARFAADNDLPRDVRAGAHRPDAPARAPAGSAPASTDPGVRLPSAPTPGTAPMSIPPPPPSTTPPSPRMAGPPPPSTPAALDSRGEFRGAGGAVPPGLREPRDPGAGGVVLSGVTEEELAERLDDAQGATPGGRYAGRRPTTPEPTTGEGYARLADLGFSLVRKQPLSTFAVDVDTASYSNVRRFLTAGSLPPAEAVRVEEMINYFRYADSAPTGEHPLAVRVEAAACPWALDHRLVRVSMRAREVVREARPPMNLVFLIDVSGSMDSPDKLPLVQASMRMLLDELAERDSVAIVTYAGESGLRLPPTSCERKAEITAVVDSLRPGGSTNGASGITLAYDAALRGFKPGGVNRVILCTDGDFNVGVTSHQALLSMIREKAKSGTFLTVLGYGTGNLKDDRLELLADHGNGVYGYVDTTKEAHRILVEQAGGTLVNVAKDVKVQVEFNPAVVAAYRLVGYENRRLAAKDFKDDAKDGGDVGAGHSVTALYEVVPAGKGLPGTPDVDPLKYGPRSATPPPPPAAPAADPEASKETLTVKVRYKKPDAATSVPMEIALTDEGLSYDKASADFKFAAAVAAFGQILRGSAHRGTATIEGVRELAGEGLAFDPDGARKEFVGLVDRARSLGAR